MGLSAYAVDPLQVAVLVEARRVLLQQVGVEAVVVLVAPDVAAEARGRGPAAVDEGAAVNEGVGVLFISLVEVEEEREKRKRGERGSRFFFLLLSLPPFFCLAEATAVNDCLFPRRFFRRLALPD